MQKYEIQETDGGVRVKAMGSTRAGLIIAAVQGLSAALQPAEAASQGETQAVERPFSQSMGSFEALINVLVGEALAQERARTETYPHVRFDLITDREAKGAFVGRPTASFGAPASSVRMTDGSVRRSEDGGWEAEFTLLP